MYRLIFPPAVEPRPFMGYLFPMRISDQQWIWAGLWVTSLLFVFAIGRSVPSVPPIDDPLQVAPAAEAPAAAPDPAPVQVARRRALAPAAPIPLPSRARASDHRAGRTPSVESVLAEKDPVQRTIGFALALEKMDAAAVRAAIELYDEDPFRAGRQDERALLLYRWGQLAGDEAMRYAAAIENERQRATAINKALSGWASVDSSAALTWAQNNFDGEDNPYLVPVISSVAAQDLYRATDLTYLLPYGRNRGRAVGFLVDGFMQHSPERAMDWARGLPDSVLKNGIAARVADRVARADPAVNAYFPSTLVESEASRRAYESYARAWGSTDPVQAAAWVDEVVPDGFRGEAAAEVLSGYLRHDIEQATQWVAAQPASSELDTAIARSAHRLRRHQPEKAILLALNISEDDTRENTISRIAERWERDDPEAAASFFQP